MSCTRHRSLHNWRHCGTTVSKWADATGDIVARPYLNGQCPSAQISFCLRPVKRRTDSKAVVINVGEVVCGKASIIAATSHRYIFRTPLDTSECSAHPGTRLSSILKSCLLSASSLPLHVRHTPEQMPAE
eukprot:362595-Chlamydomonas_euryale.AAC.2